MYRLIRFFRGYVLLRLTGAAPERCLNRMSERNLRFWGLCREDALHYRFYAYQKDVPMIRRTAMSCMADAQVVRTLGFRQRYGGDDGVGIGILVSEDLNALRTGRGSHGKNSEWDYDHVMRSRHGRAASDFGKGIKKSPRKILDFLIVMVARGRFELSTLRV